MIYTKYVYNISNLCENNACYIPSINYDFLKILMKIEIYTRKVFLLKRNKKIDTGQVCMNKLCGLIGTK